MGRGLRLGRVLLNDSRSTDGQCGTRIEVCGSRGQFPDRIRGRQHWEVGTFLNYTTTVINGTDSTLSVRYGGISVDGHAAPPLWVVPVGKKLNKKERKSKPNAVELGKIRCLTSGFVSGENLLLANASSQVLSVAPRTALTVSSVIRDPRNYHSVRCSVDGCHLTGTIRYDLRVDDKDYVFVWPGRSAVYCGT